MPYVNKTMDATAMYFVDQDGIATTTALPAGTDRSGTITAANTAQAVAPANTKRQSLTIQNASDTNMIVSENGSDASATNGYILVPNANMSVSTNRSISIFCTVAGKRYAATEI